MNKKSFKIIKKGIAYVALLTTLTSCGAKDVECYIDGNHVHLYVNKENSLFRYVESEKEYIGDLYRKDDYLPLTPELDMVSQKEFFRIEDNIEYLNEIINSHPAKREAYLYVYGTYYSYEYGYNVTKGKYEYGYSLKTGYHHEWQEIPLDQYTDNKVKDITYQFRFYKIYEDGSIQEKLFNSLSDIEADYMYFKPDTLVQENISEEYFLKQEKQKIKTNE